MSDESSSSDVDDDLGHALDQYEIMRENRQEVKGLMDDIKNEMANFSARKNAKEMDEAEIKKLVDAQEKKSNRFIMSLKIPKKQKPKI